MNECKFQDIVSLKAVLNVLTVGFQSLGITLFVVQEPCPTFPMALRWFSLSFLDATGRIGSQEVLIICSG